MEIPKYTDLFVPMMQELQKEPKTWKDIIQPLANHFKLTEDDLAIMYPSGNDYVFKDRISWALSYLNISELVDKPKRGVYVLNEKGNELLKTPDKIQKYIKDKVDTAIAKNSNKDNKELPTTQSSQTPQERLYKSYESILQTVYEEIISTILSKSARAFEELVVRLLQSMGYGGKFRDAALVTQYTNDGGIDGVIKEDILGLGKINIQAKRHDPKHSIQRDDVQKFVGAMFVAQSNKGVFITTSSFSKGAVEYVSNLNNTMNIVLIDGSMLAKYIYDYDLGMQTEQTIKIKKLDADFWDSYL